MRHRRVYGRDVGVVITQRTTRGRDPVAKQRVRRHDLSGVAQSRREMHHAAGDLRVLFRQRPPPQRQDATIQFRSGGKLCQAPLRVCPPFEALREVKGRVANVGLVDHDGLVRHRVRGAVATFGEEHPRQPVERSGHVAVAWPL